MTDKQQRFYLREWGKVRKILRATMSPKDADAQRHAIHVQALGEDKSSSDFTNADLDEVLKLFRAITQPGNYKTQVDLGDMGAKRKRWTIRHLLSALQLGEEDVERLISRRQRAGRLVTASATAVVTIETVGEADLSRVMIDLKKKCRSRWKRKGDLLTELRVVRMSYDYDERSTRQAVLNTLKWQVMPSSMEKVDYDSMLIVLSVMRRIAAGEACDFYVEPDLASADVDEPF